MPGHNNVSSGVDFEVLSGNTSCFEAVQFTDKVLGIENYASADKAEGVLVKNTGGDKVEFVNFTVINNGMTGVITALRTYNNVCS